MGVSAIACEDALGFRLRVLHGLVGRLGAGERGLQAVVQRLGYTLVLVRGEFSHGKLELVARDRRRRELRDVRL